MDFVERSIRRRCTRYEFHWIDASGPMPSSSYAQRSRGAQEPDTIASNRNRRSDPRPRPVALTDDRGAHRAAGFPTQGYPNCMSDARRTSPCDGRDLAR